MRYEFSFPFQDTTYLAAALFSFDEEPYFLTITLLDERLVNEFGQSLSIKHDGDSILHYPGETEAVSQLKIAVFNYLKQTPAFKQLKASYSSRKRQHRKDIKHLKY
jgi:hypothetical protein